MNRWLLVELAWIDSNMATTESVVNSSQAREAWMDLFVLGQRPMTHAGQTCTYYYYRAGF